MCGQSRASPPAPGLLQTRAMSSRDQKDGLLREYAGLDERELQQVLDLVAGTDVAELQVSFGKGQVTLRRRLEAAPQGQTLPAPALDSEGQPSAGDTPTAITSPLVGVFRPTVKAGDHVSPGQPLGAIEALGMPTSVDAPKGGIVEELLVADGSPVEYGEPLLVLRPSEDERAG